MDQLQPIPTGNTFDKYGSANPVVRRLMGRFSAGLAELFQQASPGSILDVGCGEGVLTERWARALVDGPVVGVDLEDPKLAAEWGARLRPNLEFRALDISMDCRSPAASLTSSSAIEVLEHVEEPDAVLGGDGAGRASAFAGVSPA